MGKKNFVFVSTFKQPCGIATYTEALAAALEPAGDVTILAERSGLQGQVSEPPSKTVYYRSWDRRTFNGELFAGSILASPTPPDVVHFQHEFGLFPDTKEFFKAFDKLNECVPVGITLHTVTPRPKHQDFFKGLQHRQGERGAIVVHTQAAAAILNQWGIATAVVIPHGLEIREKLQDQGRKSKEYLADELGSFAEGETLAVCPGFINEGKGHAEILEAYAMSRVRRDHRKRDRLLIVGEARDHAYHEKLHTIVHELGLTNNVIIKTRFVPDLGYYLNAADYIVLGHTTRKSPFSASGQMHTAMGFTLPVIAKNVHIYHGNPTAFYYNTVAEAAAFMEYIESHPEQVRAHLAHWWAGPKLQTWSRVAEAHLEAWGLV